MRAHVALEVVFLQLSGPQGQMIEINPAAIVALKPPVATEHWTPGTRCLLYTTDGKVITVRQACDEVLRRLKDLR